MNAYEDMGASDAIVTFMDAGGNADFRRLPGHLRFRSGRPECVPTDKRGDSITFSAGGKNFYAFIVLGKKAPVAPALSIVRSFRVEDQDHSCKGACFPIGSCFSGAHLQLMAGEAATYLGQRTNGGPLTRDDRDSLDRTARGTFIPNMRNLISRLRSIAQRRASEITGIAANAAEGDLRAVLHDPTIVASRARLGKTFSSTRGAADVPGLEVARC